MPTALATLTDTKGIVALAAAAAAVIALLCCLALMLSLRRMRRAQRLVLGEQGQEDVVAHAARLHEGFDSLQAYVDDVAQRLDGRLGDVESKLRGTIAHRSLIRYDAYNELSGHQSVSIALLDDERSGVVLTSIHHRDQARVYAKQVTDGQGELELSPEEAEAVRVALSPPSAQVPAQAD
ncbi:MAG TPA: DUF4446 family protein [Solirubrobacteraceae bacterium]|jgi:hypothetical protein|nr:DUF4446 family protein [Solirubrobacteraceae bacterium]